MEVSDGATLRSIITEAGRQSDFFTRKQDSVKAHAWTELEAVAWEALRNRSRLVITVLENSQSPIPIKACEQAQQLTNPNVIKAFQ